MSSSIDNITCPKCGGNAQRETDHKNGEVYDHCTVCDYEEVIVEGQEKETAMRTVTVKVETTLTMKVDEGVEISEIINEMEYNFSDTTTKATIKDAEITDFEVVDSR